MNLNSVLIGSEDPQRLAEYYTKLFGEPTWHDSAYTSWLLGSGGMSVGPHTEVQGKNAHPGRIIWNLETADVKGDFERLKAAGAIVVKEPYELSDDENEMWICTFSDPDDNYFQLMSPMG